MVMTGAPDARQCPTELSKHQQLYVQKWQERLLRTLEPHVKCILGYWLHTSVRTAAHLLYSVAPPPPTHLPGDSSTSGGRDVLSDCILHRVLQADVLQEVQLQGRQRGLHLHLTHVLLRQPLEQ